MQAQEPCWFKTPPTCKDPKFVYAVGIGQDRDAVKKKNRAEAEAIKTYMAQVHGIQLEDATYRDILENGLEKLKIPGRPLQYKIVRQEGDGRHNDIFYTLLLLPKNFLREEIRIDIVFPDERLCDGIIPPVPPDVVDTKPTQTDRSYDLKVSAEKFSDLRIVVPKAGSLDLSLESFAECTFFILFNENGISFNPTKNEITTEGIRTRACSPPFIGVHGRTSSRTVIGFNYNDKVQICTWNPTVNRFKGSFTFVLDAGTYTIRIIRGQTGLSTVNLSVQLKTLR